jgi:soluble lytic murein transglycosylase-like protein
MQSFHVRAVSLLAPILLFFTSVPCQADIYAFVDSNGVRHISNVADDPRYRLVMRTPKYDKPDPSAASIAYPPTEPVVITQTPSATARKPFKVNETTRERLTGQISLIANQHRLDPALLHAVISAESAFNPVAVSHAGAMGLMQLMPATAERFGVNDPFDPIANIRGGARYLRLLLDQFHNISLALAAYNAGENAVAKYGNTIPPYRETQTYVSRVLDFYNYYRFYN